TVEVLHTRSLQEANDPAFVKPLTSATAVWITDGDAGRILRPYRGTKVEVELRKLLERGGVVGGYWKGGSVLSDLGIERWDPDAVVRPGFGLLPGFLIDLDFDRTGINYNRAPLAATRSVLDANPGYVGLGIEEATAVVIQGRSMRVIGDGPVTVCFAKS